MASPANRATWADHETEDEVEEEDEAEDVMDDAPMRITGRVFIGSIDAARNATALKRWRIGGVLAVHTKGEAEAAVARPSVVGSAGDADELQCTRITVAMEYSRAADWIRTIPGILAELETLLGKAERDDTNVLVHCIAGRSRSVSVVAAWMLVSESKQQSVLDVVDRIRLIRPWIEINPCFTQDLHLFHAVLQTTNGSVLRAEDAKLLTDRSFPRLDFGANLVDMVLQGTKTITMRLVSDIEADCNSDLETIFPHSVVVATTAATCGSPTRSRFAYLRIDWVETQELVAIDQTTLRKSGFESATEALALLEQFYPNVTATTPLLMLHFDCLCSL